VWNVVGAGEHGDGGDGVARQAQTAVGRRVVRTADRHVPVRRHQAQRETETSDDRDREL